MRDVENISAQFWGTNRKDLAWRQNIGKLNRQEHRMSAEVEAGKTESRWKLSLDTWAVLVAFLLALLVRTGVFKHIPW